MAGVQSIHYQVPLFTIADHTPLPMEGDTVVEGVFASCYETVQHNLARITMMPIR